MKQEKLILLHTETKKKIMKKQEEFAGPKNIRHKGSQEFSAAERLY